MRYHSSIILISLFILVACGSTSTPEATSLPAPTAEAVATEPPPATATPTQPPAEPPTPTAAIVDEEQTELSPTVAAAEAEPTETPQSVATPTETAPEPTPTETAPEPTATPEPPAPQAGGMAGFRNNLATADKFVLELTGLSAPPDGQAYQGWLMGDNGSIISVGVLNINPDGGVALEWNSPNSENLLSQYSQFQVTLEPAAGSDSPAGPVVLIGGLEGETLANARRLFVKNESEPATPLDTAFALGLLAQTDVASQHVQNAINAAAIGALPEMRTHLEHVVNIIEGAAGPRFGDYDGNGNAENPGDGFGVAGYAGQIGSLLASQPAVVEAAAGVQAQGVTIQDKCLEILQIEDMAAANTQLGELKGLADQLKAESVAGLYQAAQNAVGFEITVVE